MGELRERPLGEVKILFTIVGWNEAGGGEREKRPLH